MPFEVVEAAVRVCGTALHYEDQLKVMLVGAGVPEATYRKWAVEGATKYATTRHVLHDLNSRPDGYAVVRRGVADLANMTKPGATAPDHNAGKNAILELKSLSVARRVLLDAEEAEHLRRRQEQHKCVTAGQARAVALIAQGHMSLADALDHKIQAASQEGRWWAPLAARG